MNVLVESPILFHSICSNDSKLICFESSTYLCYCDMRRRASCVRYDEDLDACSVCLHGGRCVSDGGHLGVISSVCICPSCYSGDRCQFHLNSFEVTYDTLLYQDLTSSHSHLVASLLMACLLLVFLLALPSNLCALLTFRRPRCLRVGVGHYLLCLSVVNQVTMTFLLLRLTHVTLLITRPQSARYLPSGLCGLFAFGVENGLYVSYWLVSIVSIERVASTLSPTGQWWKTPRVARCSLLILILSVLISTSYRLIFFRESDIGEEKARRSCILSFPVTSRDRWAMLNQMVNIVHCFVPLLINIGCTVTMIWVVMKSKLRLRSAPRCE
jgi:hypothetical protein